MRKIICLLIAGLVLFMSGCTVSPGQIKKTTERKPVSIELGGEIKVEGEYQHGIK